MFAAAAVMLAACGRAGSSDYSSSTTQAKRPPPPVCLPRAVQAAAHYLGVAPGDISLERQTGNNAMPQCSLRARASHRQSVHVIANINDGPQPYFVLERTAEEAAQQFTAKRMIAAPVAVDGLGIEADWFPAEKQLMATDGKRLITVTVDWHGTPAARKRALARATLAPYLHHQRNSSSLAKGAPG